MTAKEIARRADEAGLRLVRFLWCGNDGTVRAKASARHGLEGRLERGIGVTVAMQAMNGLDQLQPVPDMGPVGEYRLVPDLETFRELPYAPRSGALLTDHLNLDGTPAAVCQRSFLKRMEATLAERGLVLEAAFENEFSLAARVAGAYVPVDSGLCFSTIAMTASQDFADALAGALEAQGIVLEQYYAELGHGQQEISTGHAPALRAADEQVLVRETIRGVASSLGLVASLAPKPWPDNAGNGGHVHFSLWEGERNRFYDGGLSELARAFIAGVLAHLPGLCGLTAPSFNSYRRIVPRYWAGAYTCWGLDNREAPVRVASPYWNREEGSYNVELKACDSSSNPHLALAGTIAAGLDGIARRVEPGEPATIDPAKLPEGSVERLPASLEAVLALLESDEALTRAMGAEMTSTYLRFKRSEIDAYAGADPEQVAAEHRYKF